MKILLQLRLVKKRKKMFDQGTLCVKIVLRSSQNLEKNIKFQVHNASYGAFHKKSQNWGKEEEINIRKWDQ